MKIFITLKVNNIGDTVSLDDKEVMSIVEKYISSSVPYITIVYDTETQIATAVPIT